VRIVFAGTPDVAVPSLTALLASRHEVVAVVTRPDAPSGRGKKLTASPVAERAEAAGIEVLKPKRAKDEDFVARLTELAPDCCPVVAYGALLPQRVARHPGHGWVNLHFSLLPAWRGAAPVQHAILAGDQVTGATTFRIVLELDAGPTYATVTEPIRPDDTPATCSSGCRSVVPACWSRRSTRSSRGRTAAPGGVRDELCGQDQRRGRHDQLAAAGRRARSADPRQRAGPGAWTTFRGERFKINSARIAANNLPPGALEITKRSVQVGTATRALELGQVQAQGKKPMPAADWARGISFDETPASVAE
jgi:methionyl-tRNA formyltransferase